MAYGSWYDIIEYTYEPIEIHVIERYCYQVSARFFENNCKPTIKFFRAEKDSSSNNYDDRPIGGFGDW